MEKLCIPYAKDRTLDIYIYIVGGYINLRGQASSGAMWSAHGHFFFILRILPIGGVLMLAFAVFRQ